jgi:outer membrane protein OmpA-like peptidoglycan-associated protein
MKIAYAILSSLLVLSGCASRQTVILMPDADGHVGAAEVITAGGKQTLQRPGDMTQVSAATRQPTAVTTAGSDYAKANFAEVLAAEPPPPARFTLYFGTGTTDLTDESRKVFAEVLQAGKARHVFSIAVSGHTDASGSSEYNEKLAHERADFVRKLLLDQGVDPTLISVSSHGKGNPAVPTADGVAEPRNRRVEVVIH